MSEPRTEAGRRLFGRLWAVSTYDEVGRIIAGVQGDIVAIENEAAAPSESPDCPVCGGQYSDMPGHLAHAHPDRAVPSESDAGLDARLMEGLVALYDLSGEQGRFTGAVWVARLCDEYLDRRGGLLGRVRDAARAALPVQPVDPR